MQTSEFRRAMAAAKSVASALGLAVDDAIVLHDSNKLTLRLLPCDVVARVAPVAHQVAQFEIELAQLLAASGCPVAALEARVEPRVYERDRFSITLWTYYETATSQAASPADYASALERLHARACARLTSLRRTSGTGSNRLSGSSRTATALRRSPTGTGSSSARRCGTLRRAIGDRDLAEQLLHGEPHPGNVLTTRNGLLFIDLETCCRGPVEFDLAHAPEEVSEHYPDVDQELLRDCRTLALALVTTWRWDRDDQLQNGRQLGAEWLSQIRAAVSRPQDG